MNIVEQFKTLKNPVIQILGPCEFDQGLLKSLHSILVDGGLKHYDNPLIQNKLKIAVGDGDSNTTQYHLDITYPTNKAFSDLQGSLELISADCEKIYLLGFLGERRDHELSNILELSRFCQERRNFTVQLEDRIQLLSPGSHTLIIKGSFSVFALSSNKVSMDGQLKYPLKDEQLTPLSSHGLSNIGSGIINVEVSGSPLLIYLNH